MLKIVALTKQFGRTPVLCGVDLEIRPGRVTALVGPNGAGKTTLIKCVLGLTRADTGTILVDGERVTDDPGYRANIGYMPQIARFPDNLTGAELLAMLADLRGTTLSAMDTDTRVSAAHDLIHQFNLTDQLQKPLRTLSGGTKQKVNAVLAFLFNPDFLILDEPTAGLDPVSSSVLKDRILAERARGRTIIMASHVMSELEELADDVVFLLEGTVRFTGPLHDLRLTTRELSLERAIARMMRTENAA